MQIQPQLFTIQQFLDGRLFRIPQYQRAYAWETRQRKDLIKDIKRVGTTGEDHFMATVVCLERKKEIKHIGADRFAVMEIVDGQQRLTTLIILLKAIHKALNPKRKDEQRIETELARLLVKNDDHTLLLLQTNHDISGIFADYIRDGTISKSETTVAADQNILDAIHDCEEFVETWKTSNSLVDLTAIIRHKLWAVFHIVDDEGLVYRVFEVLNSRGLEVASLDKLKSQLMGMVFEQDKHADYHDALKELHDIWTNIYRIIGKQRYSIESLRFAATLKAPEEASHKRPLSEDAALETLGHSAGKKPKSIIKCAKWLQTVVEAEDRLLSHHRWRAVTRILQARLVAIAILIRDFGNDEGRLLSLWERITFRIYGLGGGDKRTKVGEYTRLAWEIVNERLDVATVELRLKQLGADYSNMQILENPEQRYHGWTEEFRYLMYRYEEYLARKSGQKLNESQWNRIWITEPAKSIEHIKPQSSGVAYRHHLGNLMMLPPGVNSSLQDLDPAKKQEKYRASGLLSSIEVADRIKDNHGWSKTLTKERATKLIAWARREWAD